jgi:hypothetical protein
VSNPRRHWAFRAVVRPSFPPCIGRAHAAAPRRPVIFPAMAIRWDPLLVAATTRALDHACRGLRVRAVLLESTSRRATLFLDRLTVVFELQPAEGWLSVLPAVKPPPEARSFAGEVIRVASPPDESVLVFELRSTDIGKGDLRLVIELLGNRWNGLLVDAGNGTIRAVLNPGRRQERALGVGEVYTPPRPTGRLGTDRPIEPEQWAEVVGTATEARRAAILSRIAWTSSLNVASLLQPDGPDRWRDMTNMESWGAYLIEGPSGAQPYPVPLGIGGARPCVDLFDAFRAAREVSGTATSPPSAALSPSLERAIERRAEKARRRVGALRHELETQEDPERVRGIGNLILSRFGEIPRGAERATLIGFDGTPIEVELDPSLSADRNASRYFEHAARIERARSALPGKIRDAESARDRWEGLLADAREGRLTPDVVASELGLDPPARKSKPTLDPSLPYRTFRSSGGLEIRVGRGAKHNDDLTFRHSAPTDIWLHVRQNPGAHVILRWTLDERPPRKDLTEAATLAALHSPARGSGSVPVAWTRRKHVRKPRGAPPGTVAPDRTETVFVRPDPELLRRLKVEEPGEDPGPPSA